MGTACTKNLSPRQRLIALVEGRFRAHDIDRTMI